jgi:hypothetical protein
MKAAPRFPMQNVTRALLISISLVAVTTQTAAGQSRQLPAYEVARTTEAIKVDGKLDDAAWRQAASVNLVLNGDGSTSSAKTEARVLYDD